MREIRGSLLSLYSRRTPICTNKNINNWKPRYKFTYLGKLSQIHPSLLGWCNGALAALIDSDRWQQMICEQLYPVNDRDVSGGL